MSWGPSSLLGPSLHSRWGMAVPSSPRNCQCLTVEWNWCLCITSHLNFHITDLMWWVVISLKKYVNFTSQVEHGIIYPASFSSSAVSDGTQMLSCISPSGPPRGRGGEGSQRGSRSSPSTWAALTRAALIWWILHPEIFFHNVLFATEGSSWVWFHGSENSKTSAYYFMWLCKGGKLCKDVSHVFKEMIWLAVFLAVAWFGEA